MRLDLHVHTRHSRDAKGTVLELANAAKSAGLDGFAVTDHDTVAGHAEIRDASRETGLLIVPGVEVSTRDGHLLALGIEEAPEPEQPMLRTIKRIHAAGGVAIPSHPLRRTGIGDNLRSLAERLAVAEARNARERRAAQERTEAFVAEVGLAGTGGSDAHWITDIGTAWTEMQVSCRDVDDVLSALSQGQCRPGGSNLPRLQVWRHGASVPFR